MDDPAGGGPAVSRARVRAVGARLGRGRHHPHPVRLRRPRAVPVVLPVAGHRAGARPEPVLLDGALPPDGHQPAGADVGHRAEPPARARDVDLGPGGVAQRGLDHHARAHRLHRLRGDPALGPLDAGRLRRRAALRLLALRPVEPGVRPPDDGGAHAAAADPGRPRRDPDPPAPQRALDRRRCSALLLFAQFFLSSELLAIVAVVVVVCVVALVVAALVTNPAACGARAPHAAAALAVGLGLGVVLLAWPVWFALEGPATCRAWSGPTSG